ECRRLLTTASVDLSHVLNIVGTKLDDAIVVNKLSNGKVSITGVKAQFTPGSAAGQFDKINITTGDGKDLISISGNVPYTAATLSGGAGNDTITGGRGADLIVGGADFDTANYSARTDTLNI